MLNHRIIFLGLLYNKAEEQILLNETRTGLQGAANTFQWALIDGLRSALNADFDILSSLPIGTFPQYYIKAIIQGSQEDKASTYKQIGFVKKRVIDEITKLLKKNNGNCSTVICYSLYAPYINALYKLKKIYPNNLKVCLIVPDLPGQFGIAPKQNIKKIAYYYSGNKTLKECVIFDYYVLLTEQMKYALDIKNKPCVIVEGIASSVPEQFNALKKNSTEKTILFSGTINRDFGIERLLKAFDYLEGSEYRLIICGSGDMETEVRERAKQDGRITYLGFVKKDEVLLLQRQSTVLVNPRIESENYVKYSFPSKTIEYLLSGTPVVMDKLSGVPDEYYDYIMNPDDKSSKALADKLRYICELSEEERTLLGMKGRSFILENKSSKKQAQKIIDMILAD